MGTLPEAPFRRPIPPVSVRPTTPRFGIFPYATQALGGTITVHRFDLTAP
ncbi:hypothetical protein Axi01nite_61530 [Actinoplanes xinjiangensis]|nr:hypothetical protein Axi01nite_61530 [Actinoplanes xinjiangensis]